MPGGLRRARSRRASAARARRPGDQRAVEVAGERLRRRAGSRREGQRAGAPVDDVLRDVGDLLVLRAALERGHRALAERDAGRRRARMAGLASSRFGPTVPVAPASLSVWQPMQPARREDRLAGGRVALQLQRGQVARAGVVAVGSVADDRVRRRGLLACRRGSRRPSEAERRARATKGDEVVAAHRGGV